MVEARAAEVHQQDSAIHDADGDDDVQFVGRTGDLALSDFPHAREVSRQRDSFEPTNDRTVATLCSRSLLSAMVPIAPLTELRHVQVHAGRREALLRQLLLLCLRCARVRLPHVGRALRRVPHVCRVAPQARAVEGARGHLRRGGHFGRGLQQRPAGGQGVELRRNVRGAAANLPRGGARACRPPRVHLAPAVPSERVPPRSPPRSAHTHARRTPLSQ
eukprot:2626089-Prymnesium_polylepis.2